MKIQFILFVFMLSFCSCKKTSLGVSKVSAKQQKIDEALPDDKAIDSFILPYRKHLNETLDSTLCIAAENFTSSRIGLESSLGNLMADIALKQAQSVFEKRYNKRIDFAMLNEGGMRADILKGEVTSRTAYEVMPFENELVVVELSKEKIQMLVQYLIDQKRAHPVSNMKLSIDKSLNTVKDLMINEQPFQKDKTYLVLTTDYLQKNGDNMIFFKDPLALYGTDYKLRNAMIDYFKSVDTLKVTLDKRIHYAE